MNRDDVIRIAHETHCLRVNLYTDQKASISRLERFAALVAATEREKCADELFNDGWGYAAKTIRAKGQE